MRQRSEPVTEGLVLAPLWRRSMAETLDLALVLATVGLATSLVAWLTDQSEWLSQRLKPWVSRDTSGQRRLSKALDRLKPAEIGRDLVWAISSRNRQSFGQRLMGVRRVSARNGGPVTARSAIARYSVLQVISTLIKLATGPTAKREREKLEGLTAEIQALTLKFAEDPDAFEREARLLKRERYIKAAAFTLAPAAIQLAIRLIPVVLLPKRQSLSDLAAGVIMITDASR